MCRNHLYMFHMTVTPVLNVCCLPNTVFVFIAIEYSEVKGIVPALNELIVY